MPNIGPAEILVILVVALLVFGPQKLPEIGRQVGKAARELRRMQASLRDEVRDVLEPPEERGRPPKLASSGGSGEPRADAGRDEGGDEDLSPGEGREAGDEADRPPVGDDPSAASDTATS